MVRLLANIHQIDIAFARSANWHTVNQRLWQRWAKIKGEMKISKSFHQSKNSRATEKKRGHSVRVRFEQGLD